METGRKNESGLPPVGDAAGGATPCGDDRACARELVRVAGLLEQIRDILRSMQAAGTVLVAEVPAARRDIIVDYNEALGPSGATSFMRQYQPLRVDIAHRSGDATAEEVGGNVVLGEKSTGNFLLVNHDGRYLLFPSPDLAPADQYYLIDIDQCFERTGKAVPNPEKLIHCLDAAAECEAVTEGWLVKRKGRLEILRPAR